MSDYNGWKNHATWNVALWIQNDEPIYNYAKHFKRTGFLAMRRDLAVHLNGLEIATRTPDGVAWNDPSLDIAALDALLEEL